MIATRLRLRDDVRLHVLYEDLTPYGSALSGAADRTVKSACNSIVEHRKNHGMPRTVANSTNLLTQVFSHELAALYAKPDSLRQECLFPRPDLVRPATLAVTGADDGAMTTIPIPDSERRDLAPLIAEMQRGMVRPDSPFGRVLFDGFKACGALTDDPIDADPRLDAEALLVGHATVLLTFGARVLVDPVLFPRSRLYPQSYQPQRVADLLPADAVFLTHSHPDHFDPGTLMRLGAHTPIYVPIVERESLLAVDMAMRLEELGFSNVTRLDPGAEFPIGQGTMRALPFLGEQPTTGTILHPDVRNVGCTYLWESNGRRVLVLADSGRDRTGDVRDLAATVRQQFGEVDVVFGGYRGFEIYPIHFLFSSVARFLLFVPESERAVRQALMNDGHGLLDTAERCSAKYVVPYAAGGAPWYWDRGLGSPPEGIPGDRSDPLPDDVANLASARSKSAEGDIASPVQVLILRPGQGLRLRDGRASIENGPHQIWPYDQTVWFQFNVAPTGIEGSILESARSVFRVLEPALRDWRKEGHLTRFFFMRKAPGLRLRFLGNPSLKSRIAVLLQDLVARGVVERWFASVYEPETDRFGGSAAMTAAHAWFDIDSGLWMLLDRLRSEGQATLPSDLFCRTVASDLVSATILDRAEAWAVWQQYATSLGLIGNQDESESKPLDDDEFQEHNPTSEEQHVISVYRAANRVLATQLNELWHEGKLTAGIRSVLATNILFHFHRHGMDPESHRRIAQSVIRELDPSKPPTP
jgi:thiopeptide-type bacteriocin biosynthesis protein